MNSLDAYSQKGGHEEKAIGEEQGDANKPSGDLSNPLFETPEPVKPGPLWIIDSGCTHHICNNRALFQNFRPVSGNIYLMAGHEIPILGAGSVTINCVLKDGRESQLVLEHVLHIKDSVSTISVRTLTQDGGEAHFFPDGKAEFAVRGKTYVAKLTKSMQYVVQMPSNSTEAVAVETTLSRKARLRRWE